DRDSKRGRGSSIFGSGSRERERDEDRDDRSPRGRSDWTEDRENLSWGRGRHSGDDRDRDRFDDDDEHRERGSVRGRRDQGERMSSGWGPHLGWRSGDRDDDDGRESSRRRDRDRDDDRERGYGRDDERDGLPIEETSRLIGSNKVEGTAVYGRDGNRLGSIYNFMVDKLSGKVEYAVMSYGGMLGMGQRYYPLPWQMLTYDTRQGGYRIDMTERDLKDAPSFDRETEPQFNESYGDRVHRWYGIRRR
ncbi:MAG TPA: PRC-barrel domain-containing protein, partial [Allosphingosinicella sp.]|nr:PRC-barrel domain-containing protein [Allosphingosinicella sp.]